MYMSSSNRDSLIGFGCFIIFLLVIIVPLMIQNQQIRECVIASKTVEIARECKNR